MSKVWKKLLVSGALFFSLFMFGSIGVFAATNLTQTDATKTSITISWRPFDTIPNQKVTEYQIYVGLECRQGIFYQSYSANTTSAKISGLEPGKLYNIDIHVVYTYNGSSYNVIYDSILGAYTIPEKTTGVKIYKWYDMLNTVIVSWDEQIDVDGYEYIIYKNNGKKFLEGESYTGNGNLQIINNVSNSMTYTMKVRAYVVINNKKCYGEWSDTAYLFTQPQINSVKVADGKLTVKWKKLKGATSYRIYVSKSPRSGYKKVKTVNSSKNSASITKFKGKKIRKNTTYCVYVQAVEKVNGKTYTSAKQFFWSTRMKSVAYF